MKTIKLLSLLLALLMMASMLTACAQSEETPNTPNESDTSTDTPDDPDVEKVPEEDVDANKPFDIRTAIEAFPECTLEKEEFIVAAASSLEGTFIVHQFPLYEEKTGSLLQDSLFDRDAMLEEVLSVSIVYHDIADSSMKNTVGNSVRAGDDTYSLVLGSLFHTATHMFNGNLLYNLNEVAHIDVSKPWWNKNSVENFQINDKIYMATGAITNRYVYSPYALLFNQRLIQAHNITSPHVLMESDEWTLETLSMLIEDTYVDLNSNNLGDKEDFYGLGHSNDVEFYYSFGGTLLEKNEQDELVFTYKEEENLDILDGVISLFKSDNVMRPGATYDSLDAFREGRVIFHTMALCNLNMISDMEDAYGIAPLPKYDEYQEEYYANANRYIGTFALIPISVQDTDNVGLITEALAMASQYTSLDKQYEQVLLNRQALDAQSKASLIEVVESTTYDLCYAFGFQDMAYGLRSVVTNGSAYASFYALYDNSLPKTLEEFLTHFE
ncbi:MAG: hypothetical protein IJW40_08540 [Clostridia bacterium]|nr:hypothetical protein [Clostridia bacterium]